jgi:hypothetical protein
MTEFSGAAYPVRQRDGNFRYRPTYRLLATLSSSQPGNVGHGTTVTGTVES